MINQSHSTEKYSHTLIWDNGKLQSSATEPYTFYKGERFLPSNKAIRTAHTKLLNKIAYKYAPKESYGTIKKQCLISCNKGIISYY